MPTFPPVIALSAGVRRRPPSEFEGTTEGGSASGDYFASDCFSVTARSAIPREVGCVLFGPFLTFIWAKRSFSIFHDYYFQGESFLGDLMICHVLVSVPNTNTIEQRLKTGFEVSDLI